MKQTILILFTLLTTFKGFCQSKVETEEWILEKYYEYKYSEKPYNRLIFENNYLITYWMIKKDFGVVTKIKLKDIMQVEIKLKSYPDDDKPMVFFNVYCKEGKCESKDIRPEGTTDWEISKSRGTMTNIDYRFIEDDISDRFIKAFIHLIKLNGGNATEKKEPF